MDKYRRNTLLTVTLLLCVLAAGKVPAQTPRPHFDAFDVATIKLSDETQQGRFLRMEDDHRFIERAYTLRLLIAAAYDLNPKTISGGPAWADSTKFDIDALTPGAVRPTHDEQMTMLRALLTERFHLAFHREPKEFSIYALELAKGGAKLTPTATPDAPPTVGPGVVYPQKIVLPGRNASAADLASLLQRAILDRPVVDRTGLSARFDFDLAWAPDTSEFGGDIPTASADAPTPPLFTAIQQQFGLRLEPTRGKVNTLIIDRAQRPSAD